MRYTVQDGEATTRSSVILVQSVPADLDCKPLEALIPSSMAQPEDTMHTIKFNGSPRQLTSFIGRRHEVAEIAALLARPECQLLTLAGPGGIGKTRLAIQVANYMSSEATGHLMDIQSPAALPTQITFVGLQTIEEPEFLPFAIAKALEIQLTDKDPAAQLIHLLQDSDLLLVLDNFEHILSEATLLADMIQAAPRLKLLVTSREVLNLQGEWLYPLEGLSIPPDQSHRDTTDESGEVVGLNNCVEPALDETTLMAFDATRLFVERARRVNPHFAPDQEAPALLHICRLVDGLPLAIELAAAWTRSLSCTTIADEIQRDLHFLASKLRDIAERHRSMRVVFDRSWQFLTPAEQQAFQRMVIFQGSCSHHAAAAVAGATLPILTTLVDKSLLRVDAQGRYFLHELLRQYAREHLEADATEVVALRDQHVHYYLEFLAQRRSGLASATQQRCVEEIAADWENIRAAWLIAVDTLGDSTVWIDALHAACYPLQYFCDFRGQFREQVELLQRAYDGLCRKSPTADASDDLRWMDAVLAALETQLGWAYVRVGRLVDAEALFRAAAQRFTRWEMDVPTGLGTDPTVGIALAVTAQGRYAEALHIGRAALARSERAGDRHNELSVLYIVGDAYLSQGDYAQAAHYTQRACTLAREVGNQWMEAYPLRNLGNIARHQGDLAQAQRYYQTSYDIKEKFDDPEGMAVALVELGHVTYLQGDIALARQHYQRSETLYRRIHDRGGLVNALLGLATVALAEDALDRSAQILRAALPLALQADLMPPTLALCLLAARWLHVCGQNEPSAELLQRVVDHPATSHQVRQEAIQAFADLKLTNFAPRWTEVDLPAVVQKVQEMLAQPFAKDRIPTQVSSLKAGASSAELPANLALVEPLTERELEVLNLLAEGLTNQEIANRLIIAVGTVKSYTSHIYGKLAVDNRTQAILRGQQLDLLSR